MNARFLLPRRWRDALRPTAAAAATLSPRRSARTWSLEALEPRVLLSADPVLGAVHAALLVDAGGVDPLDQAYVAGAQAPLPQNVTLPGDGGVTSPIVQPGYALPNDSLRVDGDLLIQATAGNITIGSLGHGDKISGHSSAKADHLTLSATGNVTINAEVDVGAAGSDLLSSLTVLAAQNVSFKEAVVVAGSLTVHASGVVTFDAPVSLRNGGSLTILGATQVVMKGAVALQTPGGGTPGDIVLEGDEIDLFDVGEELITGSGSVTLRPATVGNAMAILVGAPTAGTLNLEASDLRAFADGFSGFVFGHRSGGHALGGAGAVQLGAGTAPDSLALRDAVRVYGGSITVADFSTSNAILRLGAGDALELDAAGDISIYNEIEADRIALYSAAGQVAALDAGADTRTGEALRTPSLVVHAAAGVSLPSLEVGRVDVENTGAGAIDLGQNAARATTRFPTEIDGSLDIGQLLQGGAGAAGVLARAGDITLLAGPGIVLAGSGALTLTAQGAGADIVLLAPVALGGGAASFSAADSFSAAAPITSTGASAIGIAAGTGSLTLGAAVSTVGGSLTLSSGGVLDLSGVTLDAGPGGAIALQAAGDLRVGVVQAAASIALTSTGGAIVDALAGDAANLRGDAALVTLSAAGGVGSGLAPLRTAVGSLTAQVGGASGGIFVVEADSLTIAGAGLTAAGSGAVVVRTLAGDLASAGAVQAQGGGHVLLEAAGSLAVQADVLAQAGSISLLAGQALAVTANQVRSLGSQQTLDLRAGTALSLGGATLLATANAAQRLQAGGSVALGSVDAGTATVTVVAGGAVSSAAPAAGVVAAALRVQAGGAVGSGAAPLHTQVARLAASAAGSLHVAELDDLVVGSVAEAAVLRVDAAGTASALAPAAALSGLTATAGAVLLDAGGAVALQSAVAATGPVRLSAGAALSVEAGVSSTGGPLSLLAGGAITHAAAAALSTAGGAIDEQAGAALSFAAGATVGTGGGGLRLQSAGAITLGQIDAGAGAAWLQGTRIVAAAGNGGVDLAAGDARLIATGTGSGDGLGSAADALQLRVQRLALQSAGAGGVYVAEADAVAVDAIAASAFSRVQADGSTAALAADSALAGLTSAAGLVLGAGGDLSVRARVDAQRTRLSATGDLSLQADLAAGGALSLEAGRDLFVQGGIAGAVGLDLLAGRDLSMASSASATAQEASLLRAARDVRVAGVAVAGKTLTVEAGGSLRDAGAAGDAAVDLAAGRLSLTAAGGIGEAGNAVETAAAQLGVASGAGVFIDESDALVIDRSAGAGPGTVQRVGADGAVSTLAVGAVHGLSSQGALVLRLLSGALAVDADVASHGGAMRLEAAGAVVLDAAVASGGAALSLIAGGAVQQTAAGGIASAGGSVDLQSGGAWTMAQGSGVVSAGGALRLAAAGELALARLDAGAGAMSVTAAQVKDLAGDAAEADLVAASLMLRSTGTAAAAGVGSGGDALEVAVQRLAVDSAGGGVFLAQTGDLVVDALAGFDGSRVQLDGTTTPAGAADAALAGLRSSAALVLRATGSLALNAAATAAGGVLLASDSDLTVAAALGSTGAALTLSAGRDLLLQANVASSAAGRSLDLAAVRDIAQSQGASLQTANGVVALRAGGDITLEAVTAGAGGVALIAGGAVVDGDAAGDGEIDVTAGGLRITAGGAAGSGANALETAVGTLSAQAAALSLVQLQAMAVDRVATVLQRIAADGSAQSLDLGAQEDLRVTGALLLTALGGDLAINGGSASPDVAVQAGGPLLLRAATGSVLVRAAIEAAGPASLRAGADLGFTAAGDVTLAGDAGLDAEAGASISMADGSVFASAGGTLRLAAALNLSVGALQTGGDVGLTARSITDAGGTETDVAARALRIVTTGTGSTQGVGTAAAPLQLQVAVLAAGVAGTGAGGFFAREIDALRIDTVALSATRVAADGATSALADAALSDLVSAGNVVLVAGGGVVLADGGDGDGVALQSEGNVLLDAGGDIGVDAALRANAGAVSLLAGGGIALNADVGIARTGRTLDLQAAGAVTMAAAADLTTVDSAIRVQAGGDLRVAGIAAGLGAVSLLSTGGSILASVGHAGTEVAAGSLRLHAAVGVGSSGDALDTAVQRVSARAAGGGIWLQEADAVSVGDVAVSVRRVSNQATTGTSVDDATQSDLVTTGGNGSIALATLAGSIALTDGSAPQDGRSVRADGSGTVTLEAGGAASVVDVPGGAIEQQGPVTIDGGLKLDGTLTITAGVGGARGDGAVTIAGAVDGTAGGAPDPLVVASDGADVVFGGTIGATERLGGLTVDDARNVRFDHDVKLAGDLTLRASGRVEFKGALDLSGGNLRVVGASELVLGDVVVASGDVVLRVDALTLASLAAGNPVARLELAGAGAASGVTLGTAPGGGAGLSLGAAQLAAMHGFGQVQIGSAGQGPTAVELAALNALATPQLLLAGGSLLLQGGGAGLSAGVQKLELSAAQDLTLAGTLALAAAGADVRATVGGALRMAAGAAIATPGGDVQLQATGDLRVGRIDARGAGATGAVVLASLAGTVAEVGADAAVDVFADVLTLRGRGPALAGGASQTPAALDVQARVVDIDAPAGVVVRDGGSDGLTAFNLVDGGSVYQQLVAVGAPARQASVAGSGAAGAAAAEPWAWLNAVSPLQAVRDTTLATQAAQAVLPSVSALRAPAMTAVFASDPAPLLPSRLAGWLDGDAAALAAAAAPQDGERFRLWSEELVL